MKITYSRFHSSKKDIGKIFLIFCFLLFGVFQLRAVSTPSSSDPDLLSSTLVPLDQQGIKISGIVRDAATKEVLVGVTVAVEGTTTGAITDATGKFNLTVPSGTSVLNFSYVGYIAARIPLNGQLVVDVALDPATVAIEEVVVVGYGTQKKATVTGAIKSIGTPELLKSPQANISNALAGRMTGILSLQPQGQPGSDASILRIRGISTFAGSQEPLIMVDGIQTANYNNIDPNEIESISVLKDASATAVYGVRGANGVLLITTKRGRVSKAQVSFSSSYGTSRFTNMLHSMNGADYATNFNLAKAYDGYISGGYTPQFTDAAIAHYKSHDDPVFYPDVDWFPYMFDKTSGQTQENLNISGGTENVKYFVSFGYFDQGGQFNHTDLVKDFDAQLRYKRYNIRSNFDFQITKRLSANVNLSTQMEFRSGTASSNINRLVDIVWETNPVNNPNPADVGGRYVILDGALSTQNPILALFQSGYYKNYRNYLNSSVRFNYLFDFITKGLSSHAIVSYNNYNTQNINYSENFVYYKAKRLADNSVVYIPQSDPSPFGFAETFGKSRQYYVEVGIDYARKFGDHNLTGMINYNQLKQYDPNLAFLVAHGYQGVVGRLTYDYKNRYLAEFNMGYNGTENFASGKRFGFFPAYSLGWVTSEEPFFPKNDYVTYLKFKGSYGVVGNDQIGGNRFLYRPAAYTYAANGYQFGEDGSNQQGYTASLEGALGNPDLTWERHKKSDLGAEISLWKSKIKVSGDYFIEHIDNILANKQTVPTIVAATLPAYNLGKMKNSGYELEVGFNHNIGKFNFWLKGNMTYAHNVIEFQDEVKPTFPYEAKTGQRYGQFYGLVSDGLFNSWAEVNDANRPVYSYNSNKIQPGDIKYKDINSDGIINADDMVPIGYSNFPEKIFGLSLGGDYKGFDFSVLFQGDANVSLLYSNSYMMPFVNGQSAQSFWSESWSQYRVDNGLPIQFPHFNQGVLTNANDGQASDFWTRDASYVRLKTAEIGYSLPEAWLKKFRISSLRIYINGSNLITWDKMFPGCDPESTSQGGVNYQSYPITRTINMGFNVKF